MVFRVVSQTTQQFGHSARCRSSLVRISDSVFSSRKSLSSARNSLHVSKGVVSFAFEKTREFIAQLEARAKQAAFHRRYRQVERFGCLLGRQAIDIAKRKHGAVNRLQ